MNARDINKTFDLVALVEAHVKLKRSGARTVEGPCPMCGGDDRFVVKIFGDGQMWICRICHPGKYKTPIDFYMALYNVPFTEALHKMGGDTIKPDLSRVRIAQPEPSRKIPPPEWQAQAWKAIDAASDTLLESEAGKAGREYLQARGLHRGTWARCLLGYGMGYDPKTNSERPAIFIPHLDNGETVTAIKYRFVDELANDKDYRYGSRKGSIVNFWGLNHILDSDRTLLFVEGEINALSILQTLPRGVAVVSAGSDGNGDAAILRALASRFERVVIWMDEEKKVMKKRDAIQRPDSLLLKSPMIEGVKYDANQMLVAGELADFLTGQLATTCESSIPGLFGRMESVRGG